MKAYLGIDVGSVTTKMAVIDEDDIVLARVYNPTQGKPIEMIQKGLDEIRELIPESAEICGGTWTRTRAIGSARTCAA